MLFHFSIHSNLPDGFCPFEILASPGESVGTRVGIPQHGPLFSIYDNSEPRKNYGQAFWAKSLRGYTIAVFSAHASGQHMCPSPGPAAPGPTRSAPKQLKSELKPCPRVTEITTLEIRVIKSAAMKKRESRCKHTDGLNTAQNSQSEIARGQAESFNNQLELNQCSPTHSSSPKLP